MAQNKKLPYYLGLYRHYIVMYMSQTLTLNNGEIGQILGITREAVRKIKLRSKNKKVVIKK